MALRALLLLIVAILIGRLYQLQLIDSDELRYGGTVDVITSRYMPIPPRRGEILASDGTTLLAESVPVYNLAVQPGGLPPLDDERRAEVLGRLVQLSELTSTMTLSPSIALQRTALRDDLSEITDIGAAGGAQLQAPLRDTSPLTFTITSTHTLDALELTRTYSDVLTLNNPVDALIEASNVRGYQAVVVKEDIPRELALAMRENGSYLPGVVVVQDYKRRYPESGNVASLSHVLGYIGSITECELVTENPAPSWLQSLTDVVSHTAGCNLRRKEIDPSVLGSVPPYRHDDRIGKDGLEGSYEAELRGEMGIDRFGVDALERPVEAAVRIRPVQNGNNLVLTLDLAFQQQVEELMQSWIDISEQRRATAGGHKSEYTEITSGVAIVMDPRNGRVLAMVSLPTYDNNVWVDPNRADELQNVLAPADPEAREKLTRLAPLTNRAIAGQYPPGSTLKQFVGSTALQKGIIAPETQLFDPGRIVLRESSGALFELPNSSRRNNGDINLSDAMMVSSNVFFASIAGGNNEAINLRPGATEVTGLKIEGLVEGLDWFGFGKPTNVRLAGEAAGLLPTKNWKAYTLREPWTTGDTYNTAIGQGYLEVTPLQLLNGAVAVANRGTLYRPLLVQSITDDSGTVLEEIQPEVLDRIPVEPSYLRVNREGMRRSITEGINVAARDDCSGLSIAGKTGTAEYGPIIVLPNGDQIRRSHSWFTGFAPYENPEIAVVVLLEGTGDLDDGSATLAVPAVTQIMQAYFNTTPPEEQPFDCPAMPPLSSEDAPPQ